MSEERYTYPTTARVTVTGSPAVSQSSEFSRFERLARKLVAVPKHEVDEEREANEKDRR